MVQVNDMMEVVGADPTDKSLSFVVVGDPPVQKRHQIACGHGSADEASEDQEPLRLQSIRQGDGGLPFRGPSRDGGDSDRHLPLLQRRATAHVGCRLRLP